MSADRVAVVTGAARGIGEQVARRLARRGYRVALVGLEPERLAAVGADCARLAADPGAIGWWQADVTDGARLAEVAAEVAERLGPADVVVANAGIAVGAPLLHADPVTFDRVIEVNLLGSVRTTRAFAPQLVQRRGYLLQIASLAALVSSPMLAAYCASKSGVEAFAHALRIELAHHGGEVGVGYLSWIDTDQVRGSDQVTPMARHRAGLPAPFNRTYPVDLAADRLFRGIERRSPHVYVPGWVGAVAAVRGVLPRLLVSVGRRDAGEMEQELLATAPEALGRLVGPGGTADTLARDRRPG
jgi:NAD(P)-dependent dehydrogenase (short-subunit alcohol dehydrogenase family)